MYLALGFLSNLAGTDGLIVLVVALLIFGRGLPEAWKYIARDFRDLAAFVDGRRGCAPRMHAIEELLRLTAMLALLAVAWEILRRV